MRTPAVISGIFFAALLFVAVSAQQEMSPRPGPGSGIMDVRGSVNVANTPNVRAAQEGDWRVAVANTPSVRVSSPPFLKTGARYVITWTDGSSETVGVASLGGDGWIEVEGARRWVNLSAARAVDLK